MAVLEYELDCELVKYYNSYVQSSILQGNF